MTVYDALFLKYNYEPIIFYNSYGLKRHKASYILYYDFL